MRLRAYLRQRERLLEYAAAHIQHMQKALVEMNVQLHHVVSDITGETGMRIVRSIVAGDRDPAQLAQHRDPRCKASVETIRDALVGNYREEHVFALTQALEFYDRYQQAIRECDQVIEGALKRLCATSTAPTVPLPAPRGTSRGPNALAFDVRPALYRLLGVDLTQIHGLGPYNALKLVSECGTDMSRWPTCKHFTSWLSLAPGNKISGGRVLSTKTRRSANRSGGLAALGRGHRGPDRHSAGRVLPPLIRTGGQDQGSDGDGPQARRAVLQHPALRHAVRRPGRIALRAALSTTSPHESPPPREGARISCFKSIRREFLRNVMDPALT